MITKPFFTTTANFEGDRVPVTVTYVALTQQNRVTRLDSCLLPGGRDVLQRIKRPAYDRIMAEAQEHLNAPPFDERFQPQSLINE